MYCSGPSCLDCIFCLEGKRFRSHRKAILYLAEQDVCPMLKCALGARSIEYIGTIISKGH